MNDVSTKPVIIRTSATMYAIFGGLIGAGFLLGAFVAAIKEPALWWPTAVQGMILAAFIAWMRTTRLILEGDAIHYRSLFVARDVPLSAVGKAQFVVGFSSFKPYQRLVLNVRERSSDREITINLGLFDRTDIKRWMAALDSGLS